MRSITPSALTDVHTEAAADADKAFASCASKTASSGPTPSASFWFTRPGTRPRPTRQTATNELGRLYRHAIDKRDPLAGVTLTRPTTPTAHRCRGTVRQPLQPRVRSASRDQRGRDGGGAPAARARATTCGAQPRWLDLAVPQATAGDPATFQRVAELIGRAGRPRQHQDRFRHLGDTASSTRGTPFGHDTFLFDVQHTRRRTAPGGKPLTLRGGPLLCSGSRAARWQRREVGPHAAVARRRPHERDTGWGRRPALCSAGPASTYALRGFSAR